MQQWFMGRIQWRLRMRMDILSSAWAGEAVCVGDESAFEHGRVGACRGATSTVLACHLGGVRVFVAVLGR